MIPADAVRSPERATKVINWIERWLTVTTGKDAGQPYRLAEFQKRFIRDTYEPVHPFDPSRRLIKKAVLSTPKKQGKSNLTAALALVHLIGPESETNGAIYIGANTREQASTVFDEIIKFLNGSPSLKASLIMRESTKRILVRAPGKRSNGSVLAALSADKKGAHGKNPSLLIQDELGEAISPEFFWALEGSQGTRANALTLVISTQAEDATHVMSEQIKLGLDPDNTTTFAHVYQADADCDLLDETQWAKANPGLYEPWFQIDDLRREALEAYKVPAKSNWFRRYKLNQIVTLHSTLIDASEWKAAENRHGPLIPGEAIYLGLDLSQTTDLTALVAVSATNHARVRSWFWKPVDLIKEHGRRDDEPYDLHVRNGHLNTSVGKVVDTDDVCNVIECLAAEFDLMAIAYDANKMKYLLADFARNKVVVQEGAGEGIRLEKFNQGFSGMGGAINALETALLTGELSHDGNPLMTKTVMNAEVVTGKQGDRLLVKSGYNKRIDGIVALTMAMGIRAIDKPPEVANSPWNDPDFSLCA